VTDDGFTVSWSHAEQTFTVIAGMAKLKSVTNSGRSKSADESDSKTDSYTMGYDYVGRTR